MVDFFSKSYAKNKSGRADLERRLRIDYTAKDRIQLRP